MLRTESRTPRPTGGSARRSPVHLLLGSLLLVASPAAAVTLTRGPYLQLLTTHSVTIVWRTNVAAACSLAIHLLHAPPTILTGATSTTCAMAVDGLTAGAQYAYVPRANGASLGPESVFETDDPSLPFVFLVVGDSGSGGTGQLDVRDRMLATPADFMLSTGDMIYPAGAATDFDPKFFQPYHDLLRRLVFWPCLGNHDVQTAAGQPWRDVFYTPANNPTHNEDYYSFDFGNAHVVVLDSDASTQPGSPQYAFLDRDLADSAATWKFVAFHHTIYTTGATVGIRTALVPLFDRHHVDIVFMGHVHTYERTKPLVANRVTAPGTGTVYVTTGGGGQTLGSTVRSSVTAYTESTLHFVRAAIDGEVLLLQMIRKDGVVRDSMALVKGGPPDITITSTTTSTTRTTSTTTTLPSSTATTLAFPAVADAYVSAAATTKNFGTSKTLTADAKPASIAYLRFTVTGVNGRPVTRVLLRLTVDSASGADAPSGGRVHRLTKKNAWQERTATYKNRPTFEVSALDTQGRVDSKQVVSFDVTEAVAGDGTYDFALDSTSSNDVRYLSREAATGGPQLVVTLAAPPSTTTTTSSTTTSTSESTTTSTIESTTTTTEP